MFVIWIRDDGFGWRVTKHSVDGLAGLSQGAELYPSARSVDFAEFD